jgi:hypothetical protein
MKFISKFFTPRRIRVRTCDNLLNPPKATFTGAECGKVWDGVAGVKAALDSIRDPALRKRAAAAALDSFAQYCSGLVSSEASRGAAGSLSFSGTEPEFRLDRELQLGNDPQFDGAPNVGAGATPSDINDAMTEYWSPRKTNDRARPTIGSCSTPTKMADQVAGFWANRNGTPHQMTTRAMKPPTMADHIAEINRMNAEFYNVA